MVLETFVQLCLYLTLQCLLKAAVLTLGRCSAVNNMVQDHCESISPGLEMLSAARSKHSNSVNKVPAFVRQFAEL